MKTGDSATMIRIYFGEDDRWEGKPLHEAIVEEAHRQDLAGATVYRGIEGYGASTRIHRRHLMTSSDLPMMVCIVDEPVKIDQFLPVLPGTIGPRPRWPAGGEANCPTGK
ncbi:MAG: hypothetical protein DMF88_14500 [Acidobacteria bacterium]|nr:MAG: hypothetical protein DMF88_14500 [Acidobacteriota bacterium]